jgi:hypothetical protein
MKSEFAEWFVAQHGPRDRSGLAPISDQQLRDRIQAGREADRVLAYRELWDEKEKSALYAWTAHGTTRKERA